MRFNQRVAHQFVHRVSLSLIESEHALDDCPELLRVELGYSFVLSFFDFQSKCQLILCLKRWSERSHLVREAAKGPDVTLFIILLLINLFRAHVVRCAYVSLGIHAALIEHASKAKVA